MKVYKLEVMVLDFDELGEEGIVEMLESAHYPNGCMFPKVMKISGKEIGPWSDEHPLNNNDTIDSEFDRLFNK